MFRLTAISAPSAVAQRPQPPPVQVQPGEEPSKTTGAATPASDPSKPESNDEVRAAETTESSESRETEGASPIHPTLSPEDVRLLEELRDRDREVRAHEQAHKRVAGAYAGPIHYEYQTGPNQKRYAVGGHVEVDISPIPGNPKATIKKMQQLYRAALAPSEPSTADFAAARQARETEMRARAELTAERAESEGASESSEASQTSDADNIGARDQSDERKAESEKDEEPLAGLDITV